MKISYGIILFLVLYGCGTSDENKELISDNKSIHSAISNVGDIGFDSIFIKKTEIELKTDKNNFISEITKLVVENNNYLVADRKGRQLLIFDKHGRFKNSIGKIGQGPGEFMRVASIDINNKNEILLYDSKSWKVSKFNFDGKFINSFGVMGGSYIITDLNDGFYLYSPFSDIRAVDVNLIKHYNSEVENDFSFCKPFFEFGLGDASIHRDKYGNIYATQIFSSSIQKFSSLGKYIDKIGKENKYYKPFELKKDKELPRIEDLKKCSQVQGFAINSKFILIQLNNYDTPYNFNWIDIYDVKGNPLKLGIKIPKGFNLSDAGGDDLFYFIYLPIDNINVEIPNYKIFGYVIEEGKRWRNK